MGYAKNLMGAGFSAAQAGSTNSSSIKTGISAAGTTQGTATAITADINLVSTVAASSGVQLYNGLTNDSCYVFNDSGVSGNGLLVYPPTSGQINNLAVNAGVIVPVNTMAEFIKVTSTRWVCILSA